MLGTRGTVWSLRNCSSVIGSGLLQRWTRVSGCLIFLAGIAGLAVSPFFGEAVSPTLWAIEPMAYVGAGTAIVGLGVTTLSYFVPQVMGRNHNANHINQQTAEKWGQLTQQYFDLFHHDLGRPLRRILGKERELRHLLKYTESELYYSIKELLDEIEGQAPNFRLMMSNIQVLVQLEAPSLPAQVQPVEPSEVVRKIVDRYSLGSGESQKEITWWSEPAEFGIVYCDSAAIEHIVTNLVDNSIRFAATRIEIRLTKNPTHFFIRVWDDGPGIASHYIPHIFDRGWTPEMARREEKTSSGLGLFIARTLAKRYGGELTVESVTEPEADHHTSFLLSLPLMEPEAVPPQRAIPGV
jgi:signal transduction histidine kinase